jgi:hypothetical protein
MLVSRDTADGLHEGGPGSSLLREHAPPFRREPVDAAATLVVFLDPGPPDPPTLLKAVQQRVQRVDVEFQLTTRPCLD